MDQIGHWVIGVPDQEKNQHPILMVIEVVVLEEIEMVDMSVEEWVVVNLEVVDSVTVIVLETITVTGIVDLKTVIILVIVEDLVERGKALGTGIDFPVGVVVIEILVAEVVLVPVDHMVQGLILREKVDLEAGMKDLHKEQNLEVDQD